MQDEADASSPRVHAWGHVWRTALCLLISSVAWASLAHAQWTQHRWMFWTDLGLGLAGYVLVFWRRRWPFPTALILTLAGVLSTSIAGPAALAYVSYATRRRVAPLAFLAVLTVATSEASALLEPSNQPEHWWVDLAFSVVVVVALSAFGLYIGSRRELMWTLRERARQAEEQQEMRMDQARALERERIAREMHDVLAHRISLVTMHAGALAYRTDLPPEQVRETASLIQAKAHEALTDLREVLGVLREDTAAHRPQPTLGDLAQLVAEATQGGMRVSLTTRVDDDAAVPPATGRTVYRIVQEGLTNARKHARDTHVEVEVDGAPGEGLTVRLRNPMRVGPVSSTPGSGLGLVGLRERAELAGGTLEIHQTSSTFVLYGWLPWPA